MIRRLKEAREENRKLLCVYITLGYPNLSVTERLLGGLDEAGVDILELGFPFSDPLADGANIQNASEVALRRRITIDTACAILKRARKRGLRLPVIFFSYLNPIFQYGVRRFAQKIRASGFDGVIAPDLPPDEDRGFVRAVKRSGLCFVNLVAPTSPARRMKFLASTSDGFVYYVSRRGVTGERRGFEEGITAQVRKLRRLSPKPVLIGFGISTPGQAASASRISDGVVVGSAVISAIREAKGKLAPVLALLRRFAKAVHGNGSARR